MNRAVYYELDKGSFLYLSNAERTDCLSPSDEEQYLNILDEDTEVVKCLANYEEMTVWKLRRKSDGAPGCYLLLNSRSAEKAEYLEYYCLLCAFIPSRIFEMSIHSNSGSPRYGMIADCIRTFMLEQPSCEFTTIDFTVPCTRNAWYVGSYLIDRAYSCIRYLGISIGNLHNFLSHTFTEESLRKFEIEELLSTSASNSFNSYYFMPSNNDLINKMFHFNDAESITFQNVASMCNEVASNLICGLWLEYYGDLKSKGDLISAPRRMIIEDIYCFEMFNVLDFFMTVTDFFRSIPSKEADAEKYTEFKNFIRNNNLKAKVSEWGFGTQVLIVPVKQLDELFGFMEKPSILLEEGKTIITEDGETVFVADLSMVCQLGGFDFDKIISLPDFCENPTGHLREIKKDTFYSTDWLYK